MFYVLFCVLFYGWESLSVNIFKVIKVGGIVEVFDIFNFFDKFEIRKRKC